MAAPEPPVRISCSRHFLPWLAEAGISLAFTTYQSNRLFLVGHKEDGSLSGFERHFERPMGFCAVAPDRLLLTTQWQIWELDDGLPPGESHRGYDRVYVPRRAHTTGHLDAHDVALDADGRIVFVNTLYGCIATVSERYSFRPLWQPPFISKLAPEDRCHLNGMAMVDGRPAFATTVSRSDVLTGWRARRHAGGCVIDVASNEIVLDNLSMPHSPRVHDGRLWVLNSGEGEIGWVDREAGLFEPIAFCPGYLRGLAFHGGYAIVGLSKPRRERTFTGLALDDRLREKDADARCGIWVIDLARGDVAHWLEIEGVVVELYDVAVLPDTRRPMALGFKTDEIQRLITMDVEPRPAFHALTTLEPGTSPPEPSAGAGGGPKPPDGSGGRGGPAPSPFAGGGEGSAALTPGYARANAAAAAGRWAEALTLFEEVLRGDPRHVNALNNLGTVHHRLGDVAAAIAAYHRVLEIDPGSVRALVNLATVIGEQGDIDAAIEWWGRALRAAPGDAHVLNRLGLAHYHRGDLPRARACLEEAIRADPNSAESHNNLAGVLKVLEDREGALALHQRAASLAPDFFEARENIGKVYEEQQRIEEARAEYRRALAIRDDPVLALHSALLCPPLFASNAATGEYRAHAAAVVELYARRGIHLPLARVQSSRAEPPYDWAYQGCDNRPLKERYAEIFRASFAADPAAVAAGAGSGPGGGGGYDGAQIRRRAANRTARRRVGIVVTPGHEGVFVRCMGGIVERLDPERFETLVVCARTGEATLRAGIRGSRLRFHHFPLRFDHTLSTLREADLDVLYFWEVGTDSTNYFLPFFRLAPVQCTGWGWPDTSGAPELDFHLTSEELATPASDALFSERLVRLPDLPAFFQRPPVTPQSPAPGRFGLPERAHVYLCAQNLRKILPDFDLLVGGILRADPEARVVFLGDTNPAAGTLLEQRWGETLADVRSRVVLLPRQDPHAYFGAVAAAHAILDTLGFGGANTAYDAAAAGVPVVTLPGDQPRTRYTAAIARRLGVEETVAATTGAYVEAALAIGTDPGHRARLAKRILAAAPSLFENVAAARQLEEFFAAAANGGL